MSTAGPEQQIQALLRECRDDPDLFNSVFLGRPSYWWRQIQICGSVCKYLVTAVVSGNMTGKDYLLAGLVLWWLLTRPGSLVVCTAPSQNLIGSVVWKEIKRALAAAEKNALRIGATTTSGIRASPQVVDLGDGWQALGMATTNVERASGQHAAELLVLVTEGSGIEPEIADAIESLGYTRLVIFGNPVRATGWFVDLIDQAGKDSKDLVPPEKAVNCIKIPSTDSPHAQLERSPYGLADKTWLEHVARRYGVDSLWYRSHVLALVPEISSDQLLQPAWLDYATSLQRPPLPPTHPVHRTRRIAADLGEGVGRDSTAILVRDDHGILDLVSGSALSLADAAQEIARLSRQYSVPVDRISYDKLGIGRDLRNHLARHGLGDAIGYAGSGKPQDRRAFTNLRTEAAWKLRRRLNPDWVTDPNYPASSRQVPFHIPPRPWWSMMREDLLALTYDLVGNQTRLIKKEDLLAILGRSPDLGDAFIQSWAFS